MKKTNNIEDDFFVRRYLSGFRVDIQKGAGSGRFDRFFRYRYYSDIVHLQLLSVSDRHENKWMPHIHKVTRRTYNPSIMTTKLYSIHSFLLKRKNKCIIKSFI